MLLFNLNKNVNTPTTVAKGVDKHATDVQAPQPMFNIRPFDNHFNLMHQDESLMGYNTYGNFTATTMNADAQRFGISNMNDNLSLINLVNGRRRGGF